MLLDMKYREKEEKGKAKEFLDNLSSLMNELKAPLSEALRLLGKTEQDYNNAKNLLGK